MITLKIIVTEKVIQVYEVSGNKLVKPHITTGNEQYIKCIFEFPEEFENMTVRATFNNIQRTLINNVCYAPALHGDACIIGVYAYSLKGNGEYDKIISPAPVQISLFPGSFKRSAHKLLPTELEEYYARIKELIDNAQLKGDKGDKGDPFTFEDFTEENLEEITNGVKKYAADAAEAADTAAQNAETAAKKAIDASELANKNAVAAQSAADKANAAVENLQFIKAIDTQEEFDYIFGETPHFEADKIYSVPNEYLGRSDCPHDCCVEIMMREVTDSDNNAYNYELDGKYYAVELVGSAGTLIDDTTESSSSTYSSEKIKSMVDAVDASHYELTDDDKAEISEIVIDKFSSTIDSISDTSSNANNTAKTAIDKAIAADSTATNALSAANSAHSTANELKNFLPLNSSKNFCSNATLINTTTESPFDNLNKAANVNSDTLNTPASLGIGIREVFYHTQEYQLVKITGMDTNGNPHIWLNAYRNGDWSGWRDFA